ncbi:DUF4083 family protein [Radiobacillus sp. PE A8.2]
MNYDNQNQYIEQKLDRIIELLQKEHEIDYNHLHQYISRNTPILME